MEEKNKTIEKKTGAALHATQEKNRISNELSDLRDQIDIKDRKVNVLQRKVNAKCTFIIITKLSNPRDNKISRFLMQQLMLK